MPLLLTYLKSVPMGNTQHLAKACYALENFVENLGSDGRRECKGGGEQHTDKGGTVCLFLSYSLPGGNEGWKGRTGCWAKGGQFCKSLRDLSCLVKKCSHRAQSAALPAGAYGMYAAAFEEPQQSPDQGASRERHRGHW